MKIIYEYDEHVKLINLAAEETLSLLAEEGCTVDDDEATTLCAAILWQKSLIYKNPCFREEQEWRIIYTPAIPKDHPDAGYIRPTGISEMGFRARQDTIVPYFTLVIGGKYLGQNVLSRIVLGPRQKDPRIKTAIRYLLGANGIDPRGTEIVYSEASYR